MTNYNFGEVVLVWFTQSGTTEKKKRPALVVLDINDADIVLAPITTREWCGRGDYKIRDWQEAGLLRESWVRLAKITCLEKTDIESGLGHITRHDKQMVCQLWCTLFQHMLKE